MNQNPAAVLRLAPNTRGRDFVLGDIHGAFDLVLQGMKKVAFDPAVDRLISCGDLVDRGDESWRCLKFLQQPYVHAVRGNHDDNFVQIFGQEDPPEMAWAAFERMFGMKWTRSIDRDMRQRIAQALSALPLAIEIPTERGLVGVIHGDVPKGWSWTQFTQALQRGDVQARQCALESRDRIESARDEGVPGLGRLFVGHTPQHGGVLRLGNVYAVDTGAIFAQQRDMPGMGLSVVNLTCATASLAAPAESAIAAAPEDRSKRPKVFVFDTPAPSDDGAPIPFGNYVRERAL